MTSDDEERDKLKRRIRRVRLKEGITQVDAAKGTGVAVGTWRSWEVGRYVPRPWNITRAARALQVPIASLLIDTVVLGEVTVTDETLERVRNEGKPAVDELVERFAAQLRTNLLAEASSPPVDDSFGARPKRRRSKLEVLAQVRAEALERKRKRIE